jgi:hypothetical protein
MNIPGVFFAALIAGFAQTQAPAQPYVPKPPTQPLPFSHKLHASQGLECSSCHEMPEPGKDAGIPPTATCMACHSENPKNLESIKLLAEYDKKGEPIPWKRQYHVEGYVFFTHKNHVTTAKLTCDACHGAIQDMDVTLKVKEVSMTNCLECHKERNAPQNCGTTCHEPV